MPVEIRELVIKTNIISTAKEQDATQLSTQSLAVLKQQIMNECMKMLKDKNHKNNFNR